MKYARAEILREYGPFPKIDGVHGVTFDGQRVWFAAGDRLAALDPESGQIVGAIDVAAHAGTAFDGTQSVPDRRGRDPEDRSQDW
jgi:hypothetical protein